MEDKNFWINRPLTDDRRDWNEQKENWVADYWESKTHPHRVLVLDAVKKLNPESLLELGANCGPNLALVHELLPGCELIGIDVNADAVGLAEKNLPAAKMRKGDHNLLTSYPDKSVDVILADAVLIYIPKEEIEFVLDNMTRIACKGIVLIEWEGNYELKDGHWSYPYKQMLESRGLVVEKRKITKEEWPNRSGNWERNGYVYTARFPLV